MGTRPPISRTCPACGNRWNPTRPPQVAGRRSGRVAACSARPHQLCAGHLPRPHSKFVCAPRVGPVTGRLSPVVPLSPTGCGVGSRRRTQRPAPQPPPSRPGGRRSKPPSSPGTPTPAPRATTGSRNTKAATPSASATPSTNAAGCAGRAPANTGRSQPPPPSCPVKCDEPSKCSRSRPDGIRFDVLASTHPVTVASTPNERECF